MHWLYWACWFSINTLILVSVHTHVKLWGLIFSWYSCLDGFIGQQRPRRLVRDAEKPELKRCRKSALNFLNMCNKKRLRGLVHGFGYSCRTGNDKSGEAIWYRYENKTSVCLSSKLIRVWCTIVLCIRSYIAPLKRSLLHRKV